MADEQDKNKTNVMQVVANISIAQSSLKVEYAEVTFTGEVEIKKLPNKHITLIHNPGDRPRFR